MTSIGRRLSVLPLERRLFVLLCVVVIATRAAAFVHLSLDLDEGVFLLMVRDLFAGHLPYTLTWDCQPPGAYLIWAPFALLFGFTPTALRMGTDVAVIATCVALYRLGRTLVPDNRAAGILAAAAYAAMTLDSGGLASNLELMGAPFVAWGLTLGIGTGSKKRRAAVGAGLSLGIALLIKEPLAIDVGVAFAWIAWHARRRPASIVLALATMLLPTLVTVAIYGSAGSLGLLVDATISATFRHAAIASRILAPADFWRRAILAFLPASLLPLVVVFGSRAARARWSARRLAIAAVTGWLVLDLAAFTRIHEYFEHQLIPAMVPASLLVGIVVTLEFERVQSAGAATLVGLLAIAGHALGPGSRAIEILAQRVAQHDAAAGDETSELARVLGAQHPGDGKLFVVDDVPLFYLLANVRTPTRYAFSPFLYDARLRAVAGFDTLAEVRRLFATAPTVVIRDAGIQEDPATRDVIDSRLRAAYREIYHVNQRIIYVRKQS
jgi:4-amino-4-deoxy-L-arabinose transferase-like glycosyltransferase